MKIKQLFLLCLFIIPAVPLSGLLAATTMSIQVEQSQVRDKPSYLSKVIQTVSYAQQVTVLEQKGDWVKIAVPKSPYYGWLHNSAVSSKKIKLAAVSGNVRTEATTDEISLAGKSFSKQVEDEYRKSNQQLDYSWVDRMESYKVSYSEIDRFIKAGELKVEGDAQ